MFMDAIHYHVRSEGQIVKKAVYIVIGVNLEGRKSVLGMWVGENESAKFWAFVLNNLKNRNVEDILIACTDNLTEFSEAIAAVFPTDDSLFKMLYLAMLDITKKWTGRRYTLSSHCTTAAAFPNDRRAGTAVSVPGFALRFNSSSY